MKDEKHQSDIDRELRELALVDRILGLEAEVARLSLQAGLNDVRVLHRSAEWRIGRLVLAPWTLFKRIIGK